MSKASITKGFVLKKQSLLEKDIRFTVFTEDQGKITAIAKGIKKITSRRAPHIQTGNLVEIEFSHRGEISYLQNSRLISAFSQIRDSEQKTNFMYTYFFILDRILPENQKEQTMYQASQAFMFDMARNNDFSKESFTKHLNTLLTYAGYIQGNKRLSELIRVVEEVINEKVPV